VSLEKKREAKSESKRQSKRSTSRILSEGKRRYLNVRPSSITQEKKDLKKMKKKEEECAKSKRDLQMLRTLRGMPSGVAHFCCHAAEGSAF